MAPQGFDLSLTRHDERRWRATFSVTGIEQSPTGATGSVFEATPWLAVQRAEHSKRRVKATRRQPTD
jgi:hypothetical protein